MRMKNRPALALAGLLLGTAAISAAADSANGYRVVVHRANPVRSISRKELGQLFLKKTWQWPDGTKVSPVDRDPEASVRIRFSSDVLKKDVAAIRSYWQRLLFSGRDTPPVEVRSDREVLSIVANDRGAVGYVSPETPLTDSVRSLEVSD